jgi:hypothetical protein
MGTKVSIGTEASPKIARRIAGAKLAEMLSANRRRS